MPSHSFRVILPATSLPAEGDESGDLSLIPNDNKTDAGELLSQLTAVTRLIGDGALTLNSRAGVDDMPTPMEAVTFSISEDTGPRIEPGVSHQRMDVLKWGTEAFSRAMKRYRESCVAAADGSHCERFAESLAIAFNETHEAGANDVRRVPLLAERAGRVIFYGVWEATGSDLETLANTWSGDAASGWVPVGDDDEVEGRGLREAAFGLATFSLIATSMPGNMLANNPEEVSLFDLPSIEEVESGFGQAMNEERSVIEEKVAAPLKASVVNLEKMLDLTSFDAPNSKQDGARIDLTRLANSTHKNTRIVVDVAAQRAFISMDGLVIGDMPVSTARSGKYTPRGIFSITQKKVDKVSTIYHVDLPYWMRLDQSAIGLHVGELPGRPASAGCIRLPKKVAQALFSNVQSGTPVEVVDNWSNAPQWMLAGS